MNKLKAVHWMIIGIGTLSILVGSISAWQADSFQDCFFPIFTGITLIGSVFIRDEAVKEESKCLTTRSKSILEN